MKTVLSTLVVLMSLAACAQPKKEREVLANARSLENVVFGSKDSLQLEKLFGKTVLYVHSSGKAQNREEAIHGIVNNKSVYTKTTPSPYNVSARGDSMVVVQTYVASEKKLDGTVGELNLTIETVWLKEDGSWKLFRRQATKNH